MTYDYDNRGLRKTMVDGTGTTSYGYDSLNRLTTEQDGSGHLLRYYYDLAGNVNRLDYPQVLNDDALQPRSVLRSYNDANYLQSVTDTTNNYTTNFSYDPNGNLKTIAYPPTTFEQTNMGYDKANQVITTTTVRTGDPILLNIGYSRDRDGLVISDTETVVNSGGTIIHNYSYDSQNRITADLMTNTTTLNTTSSTYQYDPASQITQTTALQCPPVTWSNLVNVTATGSTIQKTSGADGVWNASAMSSISVASGDVYAQATADSTSTYTMFGLGSASTITNYNQLDFAVYLAGGQIKVSESANTGTIYGPFGTYVAGDVFKVAIVSGTVKYYKNGVLFYTSTAVPIYPLRLQADISDSNAKVVSAYFCVASPSTVATTPISWTNIVSATVTGNTIQKVTTAPSDYKFDASATSSQVAASGDVYVQATADSAVTDVKFGLSHSETTPGDGDIDFAVYLASGSIRVSEAIPGDVVIINGLGTYVVGDVFKVAVVNGTVKYYKNGVAFYTSTRTPTYPLRFDSTISDPGAKIKSILMCAGACSSLNATNSTRTYDAAGQLSNLVETQGFQTTKNTTFAYSPTGNRTSQVNSANGQTNPITYTFNLENELTSYYSNYEVDYKYNGDGLRTNKHDPSFDYGGQRPITYTWDILGAGTGGLPLMLEEIHPQAVGNVGYNTSLFTYGPGGQALTRMVLSTTHNPNAPQQGQSAKPEPGGSSGSSAPQLDSLQESGIYYHADGLGSIRFLGDTFSSVKASYDYNAYGSKTCTNPTGCDTSTPFGFTGQYTDAESGLLYERARYYDPQTQQFISRDPLEGTTKQPYVYAYGNPVNFSDPSGMSSSGINEQLPPEPLEPGNVGISGSETADPGRVGSENVEDIQAETSNTDSATPSRADTYIRVKNLQSREVKHGIDPDQARTQANRSTEDLLRIDPEDPISGQPFWLGTEGADEPAQALSVTKGHHRLNELSQRYERGEISGDLKVPVMFELWQP